MYSPFLIFFVIFYLVSFLLVMNSDDWFLIWVGLELNMLSFIMLMYRQKSLIHIESSLKYFFVQSLGSAILMGGFYIIENNFMYLGSLILSYKMGAGPFYFWFPSVCSGLGWGSCFFLMTAQKVIPLMLMVFFMGWIIWFLIIVSLFLGAMGSFNQSNIKRLMAFSSIHHSGWMMLCLIVGSSLWMFYLFLYALVILPIVFMFISYGVDDLMNFSVWKGKWWFVMSLFSMAGMPPFLGFFLKWISFIFIMKMDFSFIMYMIFMSVVMFYVYIRLIYDMLLGVGGEVAWFYMNMGSEHLLDLDYFSVFGILLGVVFMFMFMF